MTQNTFQFSKNYKAIVKKAKALDFKMSCDDETGMLLRFLATSKPHGKILELGTGLGMGLVWILDGISAESKVISVEKEQEYFDWVSTLFNSNPQLTLVHEDAKQWLEKNNTLQFDLIFADTWVGKFERLENVLKMVKSGGFFVIDNLNEDSLWPEGHQEKVLLLLEKLKCHKDFYGLPLELGSGVMILCKKYH